VAVEAVVTATLLLLGSQVVQVDQTAAQEVEIHAQIYPVMAGQVAQIQVVVVAVHHKVLLALVVTVAPELSSLNINSNKIKEYNKWHYQ